MAAPRRKPSARTTFSFANKGIPIWRLPLSGLSPPIRSRILPIQPRRRRGFSTPRQLDRAQGRPDPARPPPPFRPFPRLAMGATSRPMSAAPLGARPRAKARRAAAKPAPRVGLVSLGCPKALVELGAHHHQAALGGLRAVPRLRRRRRGGGQHLRIPQFGQGGEPGGDRRSHGRERPRHRHRLPRGGEGRASCAAHPGVLAVTGPHQYEQVVAAVHDAVPPLHDPFVDLVPPRGPAPHAAALRVSEDFRGLQQPLLVLHHPAAARRASPAAPPTT